MKLPNTIKFLQNRLLSRRQALYIGISSVVTMSILLADNVKVLSYLIHVFGNQIKNKNSNQRKFKVVGNKSLKQRAKAKGLIYGAYPQANYQAFDQDQKFKTSFIRECDLIVCSFYWDRTRPRINTFDFAETDYFVKFAAKHKLLLRGHPLIWWNALPQWLPATLNAQNAEQIMTNHIQKVVGRYKGKMHSWDVVNEAISIKDAQPNGMRNDLWFKALGPDYVELAFRIAARSDPKALLVYNEAGLEYDEAHQISVLNLLKRLKSKGTPIHALGVQSHLEGDRHDFNPGKFRKFLRNVADLGLKIMITEMDVIDKNLPVPINQRDRQVAIAYEDYLTAVLSEKSLIAVINWGISDKYTWLTEFVPRKDRLPVRPLPLDREMKPKLAWNAIARAFDQAPLH